MRTRPARFVAGAADPARFPDLDHPEIAFVGRSNVGKSSLLNRLVGHRGLARVSKTPGRTQQINFFVVADEITLADLPGYGFARVPAAVQHAWKGVVESYLTRRRQLRSVCVLIDIRRELGDDDRTLLGYLSSLQLPWFVVATKVDKLARGAWLQRRRRLAAELGDGTLVACSAASGEGMPELWDEIEKAAKSAPRRSAVAATVHLHAE